jgi:hypothetical protein
VERKLVIRTIVLVGASKWVDTTLDKSALQPGVLQNRGGGEMMELRRETSFLEDTVSATEALAEIAEAKSPIPVSQPPAIPGLGFSGFKRPESDDPITTEIPPEGQES